MMRAASEAARLRAGGRGFAAIPNPSVAYVFERVDAVHAARMSPIVRAWQSKPNGNVAGTSD